MAQQQCPARHLAPSTWRTAETACGAGRRQRVQRSPARRAARTRPRLGRSAVLSALDGDRPPLAARLQRTAGRPRHAGRRRDAELATGSGAWPLAGRRVGRRTATSRRLGRCRVGAQWADSSGVGRAHRAATIGTGRQCPDRPCSRRACAALKVGDAMALPAAKRHRWRRRRWQSRGGAAIPDRWR